MFKKRVVLEISGPKRNDIITDLRTMHSMELHDFKSLLNIIYVIKSRRMRWKGHVACMRHKYCIWGFCEDTRRKDNFEDTDTDGRIMY